MTRLVSATIFLASLLLFLVEPMAAKQLLPVFGGSASVWITCLVFFQIALLCGYLYAHLLAQNHSRGWIMLHCALIAVAAACALAWAAGWVGATGASAAAPFRGILLSLALSVGLPFVLLGSTSPLLQAWLARSGVAPYRLFALSNLASLLALLAYPLVIEPYLALRTQRLLWSLGVVVFAALSGVAAWTSSHGSVVDAIEVEQASPSPWRRKLLWFLLPMVGAMQLSAITEHLTVNVAAVPLLWVLPLAVYLVTFIVAFQFGAALPPLVMRGLLAVMLIGLGSFAIHPEMALPIGLGIGLFLLELLLACLFCHTELHALRPRAVAEVTEFYLTIAAGGAVGALLVGIVAPLVLHADYDLSITLALTGVLAAAVFWGDGLQQRLLWGAVTVLLVGFFGPLHEWYQTHALYASRNFYGSLRVLSTPMPDGVVLRSLMHGTVNHGSQMGSAQTSRVPTRYYAEDSGIGITLRACCGQRPRRIGVVGLGAGTLAAYGKPGDSIRFYEINPAVRPVAQEFFSYLHDSPASVSFAEGDGRAALAAESTQQFDVLAIDAFSGDAIPLHLLTVQALAIYRRHLAPGGVLAFHISNQFVDLEPELAELARSSGMSALAVTSKEETRVDESAATWVLLTTDGDLFKAADFAGKGHELAHRPGVKAWTDDYSSLLPLVRW